MDSWLCQATAMEVQHLLISGRKKEALQRAQEGQFWEFALILSRELGDQVSSGFFPIAPSYSAQA